jgi:predicted CXXCH cytochrome family protein
MEGEPLVTIFDGKVKLPENYFARVPILPLEYGLGHPVERHPVSDLVDPKDRNHVLIPLNCLTCHQPHSSTQPDLLVKDQANNMEFCHTCHKGLIGPNQGIGPAPGVSPAPGIPKGVN